MKFFFYIRNITCLKIHIIIDSFNNSIKSPLFPFPFPPPYATILLSHYPKEALTHDPTNIRQLDRI